MARLLLPGFLVIFLTLHALPTGADAQEAPDRWQSQVELGLNGASGNASFTVLRTGGSLKYSRSGQAEFEVSTLFRYGKNDSKVISNDLRGSAKLDWKPGSRFNPFTYVTATRDEIRKLDAKINAGAGARWTAVNGERTRVALSGAAVLDYENYRAEPGAPDPASEKVFRVSGRLEAGHTFASGASFKHVMFWEPEPANFSDYNLQMTNSVSTRLLTNVALGFEHEYLHDEIPPPGVKKDDTKFSAVVRLVF